MSATVAGQDPALDAETRAPTLIGTAVAFCVAATLVVLLRLYTRCIIVRSPGHDDYTMVVAAVLAVGVSATTILQATHGLGRHVWVVSSADTLVQLRALFASEVLYNLTQIIAKISFLLQYRRIFRDDRTRAVCLWLLVFLVLWGVTQEFLIGFACYPGAVIMPQLAGRCLTSLTVWYLTSSMNIVTDFVLFLVPIPAVYRLRLPRRQKVLVMSIFCLGFFTCIISIVRVFTLRSALKSDDGTWDNAPTSWWSTIELNCGIICSSVATLRPLIRQLSPCSRSASNGASGTLGGTPSQGFKSAGYRRHAQPEDDEAAAGAAGSSAYPMRHMGSNESQSGLKDDAMEAAADASQASYEYAEAARQV